MSTLTPKAEKTRNRILQTADELFYLHGYHATGLDAIIGQAGITKGNFYYYFKSKEALAVEVLEWHFRQTQAEVKDALSGRSLSPLETLFVLLKVIQDRQYKQHEEGNLCGCFFGNFTLELSSDSQLVRQKLDSIFSRYRETFSSLLEKAKTQGEIDEDLNPEAEAEMILSVVEGALLLDKARQAPAALDQAIRFLESHFSATHPSG
ncbi:MAG: TetR/AcrR family transcriptional regulator [Thiotrichales bacterium]